MFLLRIGDRRLDAAYFTDTHNATAFSLQSEADSFNFFPRASYFYVFQNHPAGRIKLVCDTPDVEPSSYSSLPTLLAVRWRPLQAVGLQCSDHFHCFCSPSSEHRANSVHVDALQSLMGNHHSGFKPTTSVDRG